MGKQKVNMDKFVKRRDSFFIVKSELNKNIFSMCFLVEHKNVPENPNGDFVLDDSFKQRENVDVSIIVVVI